MRFFNFLYNGRTHPGILAADGAVLPLGSALGRKITELIPFIQTHTPADLHRLQMCSETGAGGRIPYENVRVIAPFRRPVHDIICVGVNYREHAAEVRKEISASLKQPVSDPIFFSKRTCWITGPDEPVESHRELDESLDYEAELAVIIGKAGRDIPLDKVEDHIFGYTVFNDFSARTLQRSHQQWFRGKSLDSFCVMGPCVIHRSALPLPLELEIRSWVNGEERQRSNTSRLITGVAELVHILSQGLTLEPGDIIATGTPSGVGMGFDPPRYLKPGDVVECEIESIGKLRTPIL